MRRRYRFTDGKLEEVWNSETPRLTTALFSTDEMEPTKHPATGEYFTSKSRFRQRTRELGFEEVGTAYENGWTPKQNQEREREMKRQRVEILKELVG